MNTDAIATTTDSDGHAWTRNAKTGTWTRRTEKRELVITFREFADFPYILDEKASGFTVDTSGFETFAAATHMAHIMTRSA